MSYVGHMATTTHEPIREIQWTFGERLRKLRKLRGLGQTELAELAGLNRNSVGAYERNEQYPHRNNLKALADALVVPIELLDDQQPEPPINLADRRSTQGERGSLCTSSVAHPAYFADPIAA